jgi:hypothetical protein
MSIVFRNNISSKLKNTTSESATILIQTVRANRSPRLIPPCSRNQMRRATTLRSVFGGE